MSILGFIGSVAKGATVMVAAVTVLPIAGAVGTITATGATVSSVLGGTAGAVDYVNKK